MTEVRERKVAEGLMLEIRRFVPFRADCYTLLYDFYNRCYGIEIPRYDYDSLKQEKPPEEVWKDWKVTNPDEASPGDVLLLHSDLGMHLGILLDEGEFLHSTCIGDPPVRIGKIAEIPGPIVFIKYRWK